MPSLAFPALCLRWWRRGLALVVLLLLVLLVWWPRPAWGVESGASLFENHCAGCHINGGNILRRGKNLKRATLERNGITGPAAIAAIAAGGIGQMGAYAEQLGAGGPEAVGLWVWEQALLDWKRSPRPAQNA